MGESAWNWAKCLDKPVANPVVVIREWCEGWTVLFNPDTADAVGVNSVGMVMWELMDGRYGLEDIRWTVARRFAGVSDGIAEDVL